MRRSSVASLVSHRLWSPSSSTCVNPHCRILVVTVIISGASLGPPSSQWLGQARLGTAPRPRCPVPPRGAGGRWVARAQLRTSAGTRLRTRHFIAHQGLITSVAHHQHVIAHITIIATYGYSISLPPPSPSCRQGAVRNVESVSRFLKGSRCQCLGGDWPLG